MRRREVLAGMATNLLAVTPRAAFGYQANSAVTLGIIGTGGRGRYDGAYFSKDSRVRITALCDLYADQIDKAKTEIPAANSAKSFKQYQDLINEPGLDAVLITVPVYLHPDDPLAAYCHSPHFHPHFHSRASGPPSVPSSLPLTLTPA